MTAATRGNQYRLAILLEVVISEQKARATNATSDHETTTEDYLMLVRPHDACVSPYMLVVKDAA